ncbi:G-type lectin S-receptor-like serine/threonine-protein kinase SD1-13 [Malania oleifera]|uniref:G-type lectin S-receptor-like serine/threonine-protein kinase SD1-13 n=1 Tax=Malania oleifera TaxID=397392 RepID=UPI0025ADE226|nr:G-type lectin S-receptor-like serine/threonine-protein kinase SD1-13 [Malania oleifera]
MTIWESFQESSNYLLPGMQLCTNKKTGEIIRRATAWKSPSDPSRGSFFSGLDPLNLQVCVWKGSSMDWRTGPWNGQTFTGIHFIYYQTVDRFYIRDDKEGNTCFGYDYLKPNSLRNFVLRSDGELVKVEWDGRKKAWDVLWSTKQTECDMYGKCGPSGVCNSQESPLCSCLGGYEPKDKEEWSRGNWSRGCVRRRQLQCERIDSGGGGAEDESDGFLKDEMMKVPDFAERSPIAEDDCENECLKNCSCAAYANSNGVGCMIWSKGLIDMQKLASGRTTLTDFYIRVAFSEIGKKTNMRIIIIVVASMRALAITICAYFAWQWMVKQQANKQKIKEILLIDREEAHLLGENSNQVKLQELPLYDLEILAIATNNFHVTNKLGQGSFGSVYRGKLQDGQDIAIKRLSRGSRQGIEEFINEVVVISRIQHRNLVKLLGCCVEGEEKMLIYEYMPNKSLDSFLFGPSKQKFRDLQKFFNIIEGIARGLLYLHRDSRLKIIHRDLKASNILLDTELNPKILDFGMARILGGSQDRANTARIVGTFGYTSPEYAIGGYFSEKSDVFSFGVLVLEIVSGRRNTSFCHDMQAQSLIGFAWKLWNEDNIMGLVDPILSYEPCFEKEIMRCIHVGLLCVDQFPQDRPTISTIISMLSSEIVDLPSPKQPAFTEKLFAPDANYYPNSPIAYSINNVTITTVANKQ